MIARPLAQLRATVQATPPPPPDMAGYLEQVQTRAYTISDEDVQALKDAGHTEDEIFEQTVAAAITEGLRRLDAAARAIG